jgi:hypothetical protein
VKTISVDRTYIDYTSRNFGVRVWRHRCQAIARDSKSAPWVIQENAFSIPAPARVLELPHSGGAAPVRALAVNTARYENKERDPELRNVLTALVTFDAAISPG